MTKLVVSIIAVGAIALGLSHQTSNFGDVPAALHGQPTATAKP